MIEMHSKYDNMHTNGMFYALICINIMFYHVKIACYQSYIYTLHLFSSRIKGGKDLLGRLYSKLLRD